MKTLPLILRMAAFAGAISCSQQSARAVTLTYDSGAAAGLQTGSETWDFTTTSNWTTNGGASRVSWTDNADVAVFALQGNAGTVTVNNGSGQVGTGGLVFSGTTGSTSNVWTLGADTTTGIQLGAGGLTNQISDGLLLVNAPLALTASQTWTSTRLTQNQGAAGVRTVGAISGTANLNFDGLGLSSAVKTAGTDIRVMFQFGGNNIYTGTTTVIGGASLQLNYATNSGSKLDDSNALIFKGGTVALTGGSGVVEAVGSTIIDSGANTITGNGTTTNSIALGALTHNISGTLEVSNSATGIARTTTSNTNGIIGGWATNGGNRFAVGSTDGVTSTNISNTAGSRLTSYSTSVATTNYFIDTNSGAVSGSGDKTIYSLRMASGGSLTLSSGTLTIASGGVIGDSGGPISGGNLTSGTTALYVHTPSALTISSAIIDGATSVALVKAGSNTLTINGTNTYTGATYVNSGTLAMTGGSLANGNVFVRGAAGFTMNSSSAVTFNITSTTAGQFDVFTQDAGGLFTLGGTMNLKFNNTFTSGASFDLFNLTSGTADGFTTISVSGSYVGALTESTSGIWTGILGSQNFTFTEATGVLAASAIPEPGVYALILGALSIGVVAIARRRRSA